jgi:hypothetical protein
MPSDETDLRTKLWQPGGATKDSRIHEGDQPRHLESDRRRRRNEMEVCSDTTEMFLCVQTQQRCFCVFRYHGDVFVCLDTTEMFLCVQTPQSCFCVFRYHRVVEVMEELLRTTLDNLPHWLEDGGQAYNPVLVALLSELVTKPSCSTSCVRKVRFLSSLNKFSISFILCI